MHHISLTVTDGTTTCEPVAEWRGYGLGYIWPAVYQWSADSQFLYYTNLGSPYGCSVFVNGTDLHRLDVADGNVEEILPMGLTASLALSPDESTLAYISYDGQAVTFVVQDLATGSEQSVVPTGPGENHQTGETFWSAESTTAVITIVHDACLSTQTNSIVRVDVTDVSATLLIEKEDRRFLISEWPDPEQAEIRLTDKDGITWWLEINSGELTREQ